MVYNNKKINLLSFFDEEGGVMKKNFLKVASLFLSLMMLLCACGEDETQTTGTGDEIVNSATTSAHHVHSFGEWNMVTQATCTSKGFKERTCSECGYKETQELTATQHRYGNWITQKAATCTVNGVRECTCSICGDKKTETVYSKGHNYGVWTTEREATCAQDGLKVSECYLCGDRKTETVKSTGHDYGSWYTEKYATCVASGLEYRTCYGCDKKETRTIAAEGHDYENGECTRCGDINIKMNITLPKTPITIHDYRSNGSIETSCKVTSVKYKINSVFSSGVYVTIYWSGEQTYNYEGDNISKSCVIGYKLYDSQGYVVKSGTDYSTAVQKGEKFKDADFFIYDPLDPNESYTLEFVNVN